MPSDDLPILPFATAADWEAWLAEHHERPDGIWMQLAKKASGIPTVSYEEAVEVALCYGWIDGQTRSLDADYHLIRFTPRRKRSPWSQSNVDRVARLTAAGRMRPAGIAEVERAKADGRWDRAYAGSATATVPDDLQAALDADPAAKAFWETVSASNRYAVIYRVNDAVRPETRARRIEKYVGMLARGERLY